MTRPALMLFLQYSLDDLYLALQCCSLEENLRVGSEILEQCGFLALMAVPQPNHGNML